ncbi:conserved membrane hypothetical protein [Candidatus Desulfarcum epimagneticum]|uniref:O-antigen ligase-related domain-containing protein n=1 Tax=uncultured Desulfobacteraceae bacterium TaxID=218296 RepID=A0A484HGX6_9BACT|nr:conserved membrane hypothetical protein [uncultured Desulfobacteraceae bacterium]
MRLADLKNRLSIRTLPAGLIFIAVNAVYSYMFFHVNSHKIFMALMGATILFAVFELKSLKWPPRPGRLKITAIMAAPLLATLPGYVINAGAANYNFEYELAAHLILILWAAYLFEAVREDKDASALVFFVGLVILYASVWTVLEEARQNPFAIGLFGRAMATFGNPNYFAAFLNILLPLFFVFSLPGPAGSPAEGDAAPRGVLFQIRGLPFKRSHLFFGAVFLLGAASLYLTGTRAAMAASLAGLGFSVLLFSVLSLSPGARKKILWASLAMAALTAPAFLLLWFSSADWILQTRFGALLEIEAWHTRLLPWRTAWASIQSAPLFGHGLGSSYNLFFDFLDPFARLYSYEHSYNHAHSELLEYVQEAGVAGLVVSAAFWGCLIFHLTRSLTRPLTGLEKRLAIGVAGGLLAYLIHASFSVAPRMMVVRLPLWTLFGLTFAMAGRRRESRTEKTSSPPRKWDKWAVAGISALILSAAWALYLPWILRQSDHMSFMKKTDLEMVKYLEKKTDETHKNDIYLVERLMRAQLDMGRFTEMKESLEKIQRLIPHYRETDYYRAVAALSQGNMEEALGAALEKRKRDRAHQPTLRLLFKLSAKQGDKEAFFQSLGDLAVISLFVNKLASYHDLKDIQISRAESHEPICVEAVEDGGARVRLSGAMTDFLFKTVQRHLAMPLGADEKSRLAGFLLQDFLAAPCFNIAIRPEYVSEKDALEKMARRYDPIYARGFNLSEPVIWPGSGDYYAVYIRGERPAREKAPEALRKMEKEMGILKQKTRWDAYVKQRDFLSLLIRSFNEVALWD